MQRRQFILAGIQASMVARADVIVDSDVETPGIQERFLRGETVKEQDLVGNGFSEGQIEKLKRKGQAYSPKTDYVTLHNDILSTS